MLANVNTDGLAAPRSMAEIKVLSTLESNANSSCVLSAAIRSFFNRFPKEIETSFLMFDDVFLSGDEICSALSAGRRELGSVAPGLSISDG